MKKAASNKKKYFDGSARGLLSGPVDRFRGIKVEEGSIVAPASDAAFRRQLEQSLATFQSEGLRAVWLKLSNERAHLVGPAVQDLGFTFHHAKPDHVMLTRWLASEPNKLPGFASHYVGVGGLVLNRERTKLLCIQEAHPIIPGLWKLPGGLVEPGESLQTAAVREAWEETGVKTNFVSVLGFRELLSYQWGQPDLYFVCLLEPAGSEAIDIQMPEEIAAADWVRMDQLQHLKLTKMATNVCRVLAGLDHLRAGKIDFRDMPLGDVFRDASFTHEEYELLGSQNTFYSPEYLKRAGAFVKERMPKL